MSHLHVVRDGDIVRDEPIRIPPASLSANHIAFMEACAERLVTLDVARAEMADALSRTDFDGTMKAARRLLACGLLMGDISRTAEATGMWTA